MSPTPPITASPKCNIGLTHIRVFLAASDDGKRQKHEAAWYCNSSRDLLLLFTFPVFLFGLRAQAVTANRREINGGGNDLHHCCRRRSCGAAYTNRCLPPFADDGELCFPALWLRIGLQRCRRRVEDTVTREHLDYQLFQRTSGLTMFLRIA